MFSPRQDGAYDISAPGVVILLGSYAYEPDSPNPALVDTLRRILSAAVAGGFKNADLLETLLSRGEVSMRVKQLATEAANAAGHERVLAIVKEGNRD
jgi:hypothetical protein